MGAKRLSIGGNEFSFAGHDEGIHDDLEPFREESWNHLSSLPPMFGEGSVRIIDALTGISIMVADHGQAPSSVNVRAENPGVLKLMYLVKTQPTRGRLIGEEEWFPAAQGDMFLLSPSAGLEHLDGPAPVRDLCLLVAPSVASSVLEEELQGDLERQRLRGMADLIMETEGSPRMARSKADAPITNLIARIESEPYSGAVGRLYYSGLAIELFALSLHRFGVGESGTWEPVGKTGERLCPADCARMDAAAEILRSHFRDPPRLDELAAEVGVSAAKLKRDFPRRFGAPVHHYLIELRIETAQALLSEGLSVKETAYQLGYRSASHFAAAYRRRFGASPGGQ